MQKNIGKMRVTFLRKVDVPCVRLIIATVIIKFIARAAFISSVKRGAQDSKESRMVDVV